ncbi:MAG: amino acid ABC transporter permease [Proteobacteria bacterium]|nr:MAG: amino acid ABC transporter permease [Pseudomonadota bacterium]
MAIVTQTPSPSLPPPANTVGVMGWLRQHLFPDWLNSIITVLLLLLLIAVLVPLGKWVVIDADWIGTSRQDCTSGGACWVFVYAHFKQFMYGLYPSSEYWRINTLAIVLVVMLGLLMIERFPGKKYLRLFALVVFPLIAYFMLTGGYFGLVPVETSLWGGLTLTLVLAIVGIVAALPLGILLALGRRSNMPIVRAVCVAFIEIWRGVPLITVLFMASVMLPLFLPEGTTFDKLLRALVGIALFQSAYMAEVIRGGLQAIHQGQYEAAQALGLTYWQSMYKVILPQALKLVIPGIVNTFISLFKDTTLVMIIGLFDLLAIIQAAYSNPKWLGYAIEGYTFAAVVFWVFCFGMSRYSQILERRLRTGY